MQIEASKSNYAVIMLVFGMLLLLMVVVSLGMGRLHIAPMDVFKILCSYVVPVEQSWSDQAASAACTGSNFDWCGVVTFWRCLSECF